MKNIYYLIWVDSIVRFKKFNPERKDWKAAIFILNTWINALNLWIVILWLRYFEILVLPQLTLNIFPGDLLDLFMSFAIQFALPAGILNYFLIFYNNRYKVLVDKYCNPQGNYVMVYSVVIVLVAFVSALLY